MNKVFVEDVHIERIRFVPIIRAGTTKVTYKEFAIEFESLPGELREQIKQIALDRVSAQLEREAKQYEKDQQPSGSVYSNPICVFNYCPTPDVCQKLAGGCIHPVSVLNEGDST